MKKSLGRFGPLSALVLMTVVGSAGCATRRYARDQVNQSAAELSAKMDQQDKQLQGGITENSNQISELNSVSKEHTQQIDTLNTQVKQTDDKASQAMDVGQGAQKTASQAETQVSTLGQKFDNRNNYVALNEEKIPFKFNSSTLDKDSYAALDNVAEQLKGNPDTILVLEGRTDNAGDASYNFELGDKRLHSVIRYLVVEKGVPIQRVYEMSYGKEQPLAPNNTKQGRAENRAVVVRVMAPGAGQQQQMMSEKSSQP